MWSADSGRIQRLSALWQAAKRPSIWTSSGTTAIWTAVCTAARVPWCPEVHTISGIFLQHHHRVHNVPCLEQRPESREEARRQELLASSACWNRVERFVLGSLLLRRFGVYVNLLFFIFFSHLATDEPPSRCSWSGTMGYRLCLLPSDTGKVLVARRISAPGVRQGLGHLSGVLHNVILLLHHKTISPC